MGFGIWDIAFDGIIGHGTHPAGQKRGSCFPISGSSLKTVKVKHKRYCVKTCIYIPLTVFVFCLAGLLVTIFGVRDRIAIEEEERLCIMIQTHQLLHNPIERMIIVKTVVERKNRSTVWTGAYTLFGLRYAEVRTVCNGEAELLWRRWFGR